MATLSELIQRNKNEYDKDRRKAAAAERAAVTTAVSSTPTRAPSVPGTSSTAFSTPARVTTPTRVTAPTSTRPTTLSGIETRRDELKKERESVAAEYNLLRAQELDNTMVGTFSTRFATSADAQKALADLDAELNQIGSQYYNVKSQGKKKALLEDKTGYQSKKDIDAMLADVSLLDSEIQKMEAMDTEGSFNTSEIRSTLSKKYGLTGKNYTAHTFRAALVKQIDDAKAQLMAAGHDYDAIAEYDKMFADQAKARKTDEATRRFAEEHPVAASAVSVAVSPLQGFDYAGAMIKGAGRSDIDNLDEYVPLNSYNMLATNFVSGVREQVSKDIEENTNWEIAGQNVASFLYNTGMSIADSAAEIATLGHASVFFMGASSAANQAKAIIDQGGTNEQALWSGLAAGAAEAICEKFSVERLLKPKTIGDVKSLLRATVKQAGTEASEEMLTEVSNILSNAVIMGSSSDFARMVAAYMEDENLTEEQAKQRALLDCIGQVVWAGVGGALSGGVMGGIKSTATMYRTRALGRDLKTGAVDNMSAHGELQKALDNTESKEAQRLAKQAQAELEKTGKISDGTVGQLAQQNASELQDLLLKARETPDAQVSAWAFRAMAQMGSGVGVDAATVSGLRAALEQANNDGPVSPAAAPQVQQAQQAAAQTKAANPKAEVLNAAETLFVEHGMSVKTAKKRADIVSRLVAGEKVDDDEIKSLEPTNPRTQADFTALTGVQFPEGVNKSIEKLRSLYRSAHEVAVTAQGEVAAQTEVATQAEADAQESATVPAQLDAPAPVVYGADGNPLQSYDQFVAENQLDPETATDAYSEYVYKNATVDMAGRRLNFDQFTDFVRSGPGGDQLDEGEIADYFQKALYGDQTTQKHSIPEAETSRAAAPSDAAEQTRRAELTAQAKSMERVLKQLGLKTKVEVDFNPEFGDLAFYDSGSNRVVFNGQQISTANVMIWTLGHELVHKITDNGVRNTEFVDTVISAFDALNKQGALSGKVKGWMDDVPTRITELKAAYTNFLKAHNRDASIVDDAYAREELAGDLMREAFVSDGILNALAGDNPDIVYRASQKVQEWIGRLRGENTSEARTTLRDLSEKFQQALRQSEAPGANTSAPNGAKHHSISTFYEAVDMEVSYKDDAGKIVVRDAQGNEVSEVTEDMIRSSRLGALLNESVLRGKITADKRDKQIKFFAEFTNQLIRTQDLDMLFAVAGSLGFQPLNNNEKVDSDTGKDTIFAGHTKNSDPQYNTTVDFTTICLKTQAVIDAMSETMLRLGHGLTEEEIIDIVYKNTHDAGEPVPCPVCYVFSRWVGLGGLFDNMNAWQRQYADYTREEIQAVVDSLRSRVEAIIGDSFYKDEETGEMKTISEGKARTKLQKTLNAQSRGIKKTALQAEVDALTAERKSLPTKAAIKREGKALGWTAEDVDARTGEILDRKAEIQRSLNELRVQMQARNLDALDASTLELSEEVQAELRTLNRDLEILDQWSWLTNVRLAENYEPVPPEILFDINRGNDFASEKYAASWKYRTTRGPAMGKAAAPYSPMHIGQIIRGTAHPSDMSNLGKQDRNEVLKSRDGELSSDAKKELDRAIEAMKAQNLMNGQRFQSTSDFRFEYALDYLLAFLDLQAIGGKVQLYTKVPEAVRFFATMGAEVNCSLMPLGIGYDPETKELLFSSVTGMSAEDAFALAQEFDNVQTIMVGTSVEHMLLCMADDRIQFIIPYHASGAGEARYQSMMNTVGESVSTRDDFSPYQTDREIATEDPAILAARSARKKILTGDVNLTESEIAQIRKLKDAGNDILWELHKRFTGKTVDGEREPLNQKYLEPSQRSDSPVYRDDNCYLVKMGSAAADVLFPFEYWDKTTTLETADRNGEIFNDYCKVLGLKPRFSAVKVKGHPSVVDFNKLPGYWKMLIDRRMYNRDGSYHEQRAIDVTNMDAEFLYRYTDTAGNWSYSGGEGYTPTRAMAGLQNPSRINDRSKISEIADKSVKEISKMRFSVIDSEGDQGYNNRTYSTQEGMSDGAERLSDNNGAPSHAVRADESRPRVGSELDRGGQAGTDREGESADNRALQDLIQAVPALAELFGGKQETKTVTRKEAQLAIAGLDAEDAKVAQDVNRRAYYSSSLAALSDKRLDRVYGDYGYPKDPSTTKGYLVYIDPFDFLCLTTTDPMKFLEQNPEKLNEGENRQWGGPNNIQDSGALYLSIDTDGNVTGHEGRHRMAALYREGVERAAVVLETGKVENAKPIVVKKLLGQMNSGITSYASSYIHNALPISKEYETVNRYVFGSVSDDNRFAEPNIRYSIVDSTGKSLTKEQQEYFKDSKARDSKGRLMTMFHGTQSFGFTVFDPKYSDDGRSLFFTSRPEVARTYSGTGGSDIHALSKDTDMRLYQRDRVIHSLEKALEILETVGVKKVAPNPVDDSVILDRVNLWTEETLEEAQEWLDALRAHDNDLLTGSDVEDALQNLQYYRDHENYLRQVRTMLHIAREFKWLRNQIKQDTELGLLAEDIGEGLVAMMDGVIPQIPNLKNLADVLWSEYDVYAMLDPELGFTYMSSKMIVNKAEEMRKRNLEGLYAVYVNVENPLVVNANYREWNDLEWDGRFDKDAPQWEGDTTREIAEWAEMKGYDGVIFRDLVDLGAYADYDEGGSDIVIAFRSDQVKSTANENPTKDPDIRYSIVDSTGKSLTKAQAEYFKYSKVRDKYGNLIRLYHGTKRFGFTKIDTRYSDDGISFFMTDNLMTAESYSGTSQIRSVSNPDADTQGRLDPHTAPIGDVVDEYSWLTQENLKALTTPEALREWADNKLSWSLRHVDSIVQMFDQMLPRWDGEIKAAEWGPNPEMLDAYNAFVPMAEAYKMAKNAVTPREMEAAAIKLNNAQTLSHDIDKKNVYYWMFYTALEPVNIAQDLQQASNALRAAANNETMIARGNQYVFSEQSLREALEREYEFMAEDGAGNYPLYANLTNPLVVEANGSNWGHIRIPHDLIEAFRKHFSDPGMVYAKTRDFAAFAKANGYDGVMFRDLVDYGPHVWEEDPATVVIAFESNQVKDAYNENPTKDPDIRYSIVNPDLSFADQVDLARQNKLNEFLAPGTQSPYGLTPSAVYVAKEPNSLMQELGYGDLPIVMTQRHLRQIVSPREDSTGKVIDSHNHQLEPELVKRLPDLLQRPAAVIRATQGRDNTLVFVTIARDYARRPVVVPIKANGTEVAYDGEVGPAHIVTSMYGHESFDDYFTKAVNDGRVVFMEKERIDPMLTIAEDQRLGLLSAVDSGTIMGEVQPNVKTPGTRKFSVADANYMAAVNRGDMETAQRMVDEAAKAAGYVVRGYHGTTNLFTVFDTSKSNIENDWGRGIYASTSLEDVETNYASEYGADLTHRIERLAEQMQDWEEYEDMDHDQRIEAARKQLSEGEHAVLRVALRMDSPVIVERGSDGTFFSYKAEYDEETAEYSEPSGTLIDVVEAMQEIIYNEYEWAEYDADKLNGLYFEAVDDGGMSAIQLQSAINDILVDVSDEFGNIAGNEILRKALEKIGYDGIIDKTVAYKFGSLSGRRGAGMRGVNRETVHYIAFNPKQAKLTDPVTYDDNGNVIPLSERFKTDNPDIRYSITPEFEQWYKEQYGEEDVTNAQLKRRLETQERRTKQAEESAKAAETLAASNAALAWSIYHQKKMREQKRRLDEQHKTDLAVERWKRIEAVAATAELERAKAAVQHEEDVARAAEQRDRQRRKSGMAEAFRSREREMSMKRDAAKRLRTKVDAYSAKVEGMKERLKLQRNAAKAILRDSKLAQRRQNEIEAEQGIVDTIRKSPPERTKVERLQESAQKLRTMGRSTYRNFVNVAEAIDRFSKRQVSDMRAGTLVNIAGGSASTIEAIFKNGLVNRAGDRIGDSMSEVFLCWDDAHRSVDENKQALLQDFMLHWHNIDRMTIEARAEARLDTFELNNTWLRDMDQKELARLYAMTETEAKKLGKESAQLKAFEYRRLIRECLDAKNKHIFADDKGNAVTAETSQQIVKDYIEKHPWLLEKANGIHEWWDKFMREWAVGDTISEAEYNRMRQMYPHYVPTYRVDKLGPGGANFVSSSGAVVGKAVKRAKGSFAEVVNIEDSFVNIVSKIVKLNRVNELYMNIIDTAMLDDAGLFSDLAAFDWDSSWQVGDYAEALRGDLTETVDNADTAGLEKVGKDYKLTAWRDGRKLTAFIHADLYLSIAGVTGHLANDLEQNLLKIGNILTGPMKTAITGINPMFAARNMARDLPTAVVNSISGMAFPKYWTRAAKEMAQNSEHWQHFQALGGTHATHYNTQSGAKQLTQSESAAKRALGKLGWFNEVTESQTRFAEYLATIDRLGDTYENRLQGIKNSAEVTVDFSRKGRYGKVINAWVPYWNPAVQGIDKVVRSVIDSPDGSAVWKQASKTLGRAAMTTILFEAILQGVLHALDRDDEWEELDDRTKDTYYCIPLKNEHKFLKIPKNREWGAILGTPFMRMLEYANGRENPFENYIETAIEPNFLPPGVLEAIGIDQALAIATNKDFAGRDIVPYAYQQGTKAEQYNSDTSVAAKALSDLIGNKLSPMQIDYIISDYFGDFGDLFQIVTSEATWSGDRGVGEALLDVVKSPWEADSRYSNAGVSKYYDTMDALKQVVNDKKNQLGNEAYKQTIEYQTQKAVTDLYGDQISDLNRVVRELPDGDEKDAAKAQIAQLTKEALQYYEDCMAGRVNAPVLDAEYKDLNGTVSKELIRLDSLSSEYKFKPAGTPQKQYPDPQNKQREYILTDDQKDYFKELYRDTYSEMFLQKIQTSRYMKAKDADKAAMLETLRDDVLDATKDAFFDWLRKNGVRSTPKTKK